MATLLRNILVSACLLLLVGCSTLQRAGLAAGGAAAGSFLGPAGAAAGAAGGVIASDVIDAQSDPVTVIAGQAGVPTGPAPGTAASTIHESKNFIESLGYWYLLIFIVVPFLTKNGRKWFGNLASLHKTATEKDMTSAADRLNKLEGMISSLSKDKE